MHHSEHVDLTGGLSQIALSANRSIASSVFGRRHV